jgi:hypothetical protein
MDDAITAFLIAEDDDNDIEEQYRWRAILCAAIVGHGIHRIKAEHSRAHQHYLTRPVLLPTPRSWC